MNSHLVEINLFTRTYIFTLNFIWRKFSWTGFLIYISENVQTGILRKEQSNLTEELDLEKDLIDHLVQNGGIDISDSEQIQKISRRKDKVRYLLVRLHRYGPDRFEKFIMGLYETNPDIARRLQASYHSLRNEDNSGTQCLHCAIKQRVDIGDVVDKFFEYKLINIDFMEDYLHGTTSPDILWNHIYFNMKTSKADINPLHILRASMQSEKYQDIKKQLVDLPDTQRYLLCRELQKRRSSMGSERSFSSPENDLSSDSSSIQWRETLPNSVGVQRTSSMIDKRHDRARHTEFIKRYKQGPREEDVKEDNGEETPVKQIRGTSSNSTPQLPYYKDPRRRPIYISSKYDFALSDQHYDGIIHARSDESLTLKNTDELFFSQT